LTEIKKDEEIKKTENSVKKNCESVNLKENSVKMNTVIDNIKIDKIDNAQLAKASLALNQNRQEEKELTQEEKEEGNKIVNEALSRLWLCKRYISISSKHT
jgi:hypothetical protein